MTYQNFVTAASSFYDAGFLNNGDDTINKRELAAFLAQASQVRGTQHGVLPQGSKR